MPNALSFVRSWRLRRKKIELVNSDHRYWFTPYTISKVMCCAGIVPQKILFGSDKTGGNGSLMSTELFFRLLEKMRRKPSHWKSYLGDSIIVIGK